MSSLTNKELLDAGVHFGHLRKKWNPKMAPYIFMERKGLHLIDLNKTLVELEKAGNALKGIARSGRKILFVATKKQAKDMVKEYAQKVNMPFVTERWLGGMLTNFATIRKSVKKMQSIDKLIEEDSITKKEKLMMTREKNKMERVIGGIAGLNRIPAAIYIVDTSFEHIALAESRKLGLTTFGMVDTNSDPTLVDFPIPANDDASKSIELITSYLTNQILEGLQERKAGKGDESDNKAGEGDGEKRQRKTRGRKRKGNNDKEDFVAKDAAKKAEATKPAADKEAKKAEGTTKPEEAKKAEETAKPEDAKSITEVVKPEDAKKAAEVAKPADVVETASKEAPVEPVKSETTEPKDDA